MSGERALRSRVRVLSAIGLFGGLACGPRVAVPGAPSSPGPPRPIASARGAAAPASARPSAAVVPPRPKAAPSEIVPTSSTARAAAIAAGRLPWWSELPPGSYRLHTEGLHRGDWILATGASTDHHHTARGILNARVAARLALDTLSVGPQPPEPILIDLFVTPEDRVFVLYGRPLPAGAPSPLPLRPPESLIAVGLHRIGLHRFQGGRHLFLECDVEGPLANPDWGAERVMARLAPETP